jgi:hypothetical protein
MTHLRKMVLEELERRNYAQTTIDCYLRAVAEFFPPLSPPSEPVRTGAHPSGGRTSVDGECWTTRGATRTFP